jgi:hypothetical protein
MIVKFGFNFYYRKKIILFLISFTPLLKKIPLIIVIHFNNIHHCVNINIYIEQITNIF